MSRPIQVGDIARITSNGRTYDFPITAITPTIIYAPPYQLVPSGVKWVIRNHLRPSMVEFAAGPLLPKYIHLKVASLNLGYQVMANRIAGSEAGLVKACQTSYAGGWKNSEHTLSVCTHNAAKLLANYHIFGVQEVNLAYIRQFIQTINESNPSAKYHFIPGLEIMIGYDETITGEGVPLTSSSHRLGDRGLQAVWFPKLDMIFVNLHAPHNIDLIPEIHKSLAGITIQASKALIVGDFNDFAGLILKNTISAFGLTLRLPGPSPNTCCADTTYAYPGDYIFTNLMGYYGYPPKYIRGSPLLSDHDPITFETDLIL
jgi:hypothetical protein